MIDRRVVLHSFHAKSARHITSPEISPIPGYFLRVNAAGRPRGLEALGVGGIKIYTYREGVETSGGY